MGSGECCDGYSPDWFVFTLQLPTVQTFVVACRLGSYHEKRLREQLAIKNVGMHLHTLSVFHRKRLTVVLSKFFVITGFIGQIATSGMAHKRGFGLWQK